MASDGAHSDVRAGLLQLYEAAVAAAHPDICLPTHLPFPPPGGRLWVVGAGKAGAAMALAAERHYRNAGVLDRVAGFVTVPYGNPVALHEQPSVIGVACARPPHPDEASGAAARPSHTLVAGASERDLVLVLLSGGASALWAAPTTGLTLDDKIGLSRGLLKCGA